MLLIRLAAQNLGRRRLRALLLGIAVALAVGIGVAGLVAGRALGDGIAASFSSQGTTSRIFGTHSARPSYSPSSQRTFTFCERGGPSLTSSTGRTGSPGVRARSR